MTLAVFEVVRERGTACSLVEACRYIIRHSKADLMWCLSDLHMILTA